MQELKLSLILAIVFALGATAFSQRMPVCVHTTRGSVLLRTLWEDFKCLTLVLLVLQLDILVLVRPEVISPNSGLASLAVNLGLTTAHVIGIQFSVHLVIGLLLLRACQVFTHVDFVSKFDQLNQHIAERTHNEYIGVVERYEVARNAQPLVMTLVHSLLEFCGAILLASTLVSYFD